MEPEVAEEVRRCMDADGMTIIDGITGAPVANKFFTRALSEVVGGGARSKSAYWISEQAEVMVIKISEDAGGKITIHRGYGPGSTPKMADHGAGIAPSGSS